MARNTNGIATKSDCNNIIANVFNSELTKCPTKQEILNTGKLSISSNYANNQLVKYQDISMSYINWDIYWYDFSQLQPDVLGWTITDGTDLPFYTGSNIVPSHYDLCNNSTFVLTWNPNTQNGPYIKTIYGGNESNIVEPGTSVIASYYSINENAWKKIATVSVPSQTTRIEIRL